MLKSASSLLDEFKGVKKPEEPAKPVVEEKQKVIKFLLKDQIIFMLSLK